MVAAATVEVPGFRAVRVGNIDDRGEAVSLGNLPELGQRDANRAQVDVHSAAGLMQTTARWRTEGLFPTFHEIGVRLRLLVVGAEEIAQADSESHPRQIAGHRLDRRFRVRRALRQAMRQGTVIDRSDVEYLSSSDNGVLALITW